MIKVRMSEYALSEEELNHLEQKDGLTLISVNHVLTHEYPRWTGISESKREVVRWTYHFRTTAKKDEES